MDWTTATWSDRQLCYLGCSAVLNRGGSENRHPIRNREGKCSCWKRLGIRMKIVRLCESIVFSPHYDTAQKPGGQSLSWRDWRLHIKDGNAGHRKWPGVTKYEMRRSDTKQAAEVILRWTSIFKLLLKTHFLTHHFPLVSF